MDAITKTQFRPQFIAHSRVAGMPRGNRQFTNVAR
jgi:hypothetical protein